MNPTNSIMRKFPLVFAGAALAWTFNPFCITEVYAQARVLPESRIERAPGGFSILYGNSRRAVLGITLAAAGRGDTLGVRVDDVDPNGPAAKAGLESGMFITAIDDVSLRLSREDAADDQLLGLAQRRLTRTLQKASAGDEVTLQVYDKGASRTMKVKTVAASELAKEPVRGAMSAVAAGSNRAALGMSIGVTGSIRDTLGLFVSSVVTGGPAEKAGVIEGDRIAEINGVDLRVPKEDVEDIPGRMARVTRFNRELQKSTAGDRVTLRVVTAGRPREVALNSVKASELPSRGLQMQIGDGAFYMGTPGGILDGWFNRGEGGRGAVRLEMKPGSLPLDEFGRESFEKAMEQLRMNLRELPRRIQVNPPGVIRTSPSKDVRVSTSVPASRRAAAP